MIHIKFGIDSRTITYLYPIYEIKVKIKKPHPLAYKTLIGYERKRLMHSYVGGVIDKVTILIGIENI